MEKDKRVQGLIKHAGTSDTTGGGVIKSGDKFKEMNLPPNAYTAFDPDPSFNKGNDNTKDHPLFSKKPFSHNTDPKASTEEEKRQFLDKQNKRVNDFWKLKRNN